VITSKAVLTQPFRPERQFTATTGSEHHMLLDHAVGGTGPKPIELVAARLAEIDPAAIEEAIRLSEEKYCSVGAMVKQTASLHTTYEIVDEKSQGLAATPVTVQG
jgi:uncharacterized OsmC-like protein